MLNPKNAVVDHETDFARLVRSRSNDRNYLIEGLNADGFNPFPLVYQQYGANKVEADGHDKIMAASYSYLNMGEHPDVKAAVLNAIDRFGASGHGSRILAGSTQLHLDLESHLASFIGGESAVVFPTGWITNFATISSIFGPDDTIITDLRNHNSIHAGTTASGARTIFFNAEKPGTLKRALSKVAPGSSVLVVADAIFSMDGTIIPLPEIVDICKNAGAFLMLDEAHSIGVLGNNGRGITEHFGIDPNDIDILMGNISKAIAGNGGYIVARSEVCEFLRYRADGYMFSNAIPPQLAAASLETIRVLERDPSVVKRLRGNAERFRSALLAEGIQAGGEGTPIVPIVFADEQRAIAASKRMWEMGVFVLPAIYPAVPRRTPRLRFCINAVHTPEQLDFIVQCLKQVLHDDQLIDLTL